MFNEFEIASLAEEHYNLNAGVKLLPGFDEWNYLLTTEEGEKFVLKIAEADHSKDLLQAQYRMTSFLAQSGMHNQVPEFRLNYDGDANTVITISNGKKYYLRVVKYLPGTFIAQISPKSPELLENFGRFLGKMDTLLGGFDHPGTHRYLDWDLQHALDWRKYLHQITSHEGRRIAAYFLLQFETNVLPCLSDLRHGVIHNDANDWNVLVEGNQVNGIIDFGDIVHAPVVNNLAIALAYIVLGKKEPLSSAASLVKGYHLSHALMEKEVSLLYYLLAARLCVSVTSSAHQRTLGSTNEHHFVSEKPAWKALHHLIQINPIEAHQAFREVCGMSDLYDVEEDYSALLQERNKHIGSNLSISYHKNLKIEQGALQYLYDDKGNTFLDCVNNVSHVGHCHPAVVQAMRKQIATLNTNTRYLHDGLQEYADELCRTLPEELSVCYFTNSGSEANDLAVRMARNYTQQKDVIVLDHAYHGTSTLAIEMSPYKFDGPGGFPQPGYIHKAQNPDCYRGEFRYGDLAAGKKYAGDVQRIINDLSRKNKKPAVFICETLLGVGGQIPLPKGYLGAAYHYVREAGGVCIADEVQVGFGRVGSAFWGFQLQEVVPDIVVMGKPIGNGHPLSAVVVSKEIADAFDNGMEYFNTFGGNPVSMATGLAVLTVIKEEKLQENARKVGAHLLERLKELQKEHEIIGDVRGKGLFIGAEFVKDRQTLEPAVQELDEVVEQMRGRGFLLSTDGPLHNVLKIKPPIVFTEQNADDLIDALRDVLIIIDEP